MARFRRSFRGRGSSKPIHPVTWCSTGLNNQELNVWPSTGEVTICGTDKLAEYTSPTVVRVRGDIELSLGRTQSTVVSKLQGALAVTIKDENQIVDDILTADNADRPFMWVRYFELVSPHFTHLLWDSDTNTITETSRFNTDTKCFLHIPVDVKAMRRVPKDSQLMLVWSIRQVSGDPTMHMGSYLRALIKE